MTTLKQIRRHIIWMFFICCFANSIQAETIMIGTAPENPPLSFQADDKNHFYGFEVDLMNEICRRIKLSCVYKSVGVSFVLRALESQNIDFAIAALVTPSDELKGYVYSLPYLQSGGQFLTMKNSSIQAIDSIKHKRVGVRRGALGSGSMYKNLIMQLYNNQVTVLEYDTMNTLIQALSNNQIDVIFSNALLMKYWYLRNPDLYRLVGAKVPLANSYVILAQDRYQLLMQRINQELLAMMADGTYLTIYERYFSYMK